MKSQEKETAVNPMESSKRKRAAEDDSRYGGDRRKLRRGRGEERGRKEGDRDRDRHDAAAAVDDAEVEEFYAILQRVRAVSRCIAVGDAARRTEAERFRWQPAFVWEDFEGGAGAAVAVKVDGGEGKEVSSEDKGEEEVRVRGLELDLNVDPEPEGGELTNRCTGAQA